MKSVSLAIVGLAGLAAPAVQAQTAPAPIITLSVGEEVSAAPDMATVGTGVQIRAATARDAMAQNAALMGKLTTAIRNAGIAAKDIQTSGIALNPYYDYNTNGAPPRFIGYEASNQLTVKIRALPRAGEIIDQLVAAGASNINGPSFAIADEAPLLMQARSKALKTAQERAGFYAAQSGYKNVRLVAISETGAAMPGPVPMIRSMVAKADTTTVEPGQLSVGVTLTVQYALEQ